MPPNKLHQHDHVEDLTKEIYDLKKTVALIQRDNEVSDKRLTFLEKITFGAIGIVVLGVLSTLGGVIIWALSSMGFRKQ